MDKSLTFLEMNPHLIATSYLKKARDVIDTLVKKAESTEFSSNKVQIDELKKEIAKL